jgi:hypothetical protein
MNPLTKSDFKCRQFRAIGDRSSEVNRRELIELIAPTRQWACRVAYVEDSVAKLFLDH